MVKNLAETPLFIESHASRVVQLADHVAYAVFRRYNAGDSSYLDLIQHRFDSDGGRMHGLVHKHASPGDCPCPARLSRRLSRGETRGGDRGGADGSSPRSPSDGGAA